MFPDQLYVGLNLRAPWRAFAGWLLDDTELEDVLQPLVAVQPMQPD